MNKTEEARIKIIVDGKLANASLREMESEARKAKSTLRGLAENDPNRAKLLDDFRKLNRAIQDQKKELNDTRTGWQRLKDEARGTFTGVLGANLVEKALSSLWNGIKNIVKVQKEFESSLKNLSAITGLTGNDLKFMGEEAQKTALKTGIASRDIVEAYKLIASAKPELLTQKELLAKVTNEAIVLSKASGLDLPEASKRLTDAMNQFNIPGEKAGEVVNVLAEGAKLSAAEVPDITEAMLKFGVAAKASNIPLSDSVALIETMAEKGLKGAEAGTAIRNVLAKLSAPETLPKIAIDYLKAAGVSLDVLKDKSKPVSERLEELGKIQGNAAALTEVFGLENKNAAQILIENRNRVKELSDALGKGGLTSAYEQAETNTQTLSTSINKLGTTWDTIMQKQGAIGGFLNSIVMFFTRALIAVDNFKSEMDVLFGGVISASEETKEYLLDFGRLDNGKQISKFLKPYEALTDADFLKKSKQAKDEFVERMKQEGESAEEAAVLFDTYIRKRTDSLISSYKSKQQGGQITTSSADGAAADLVINRNDKTNDNWQNVGDKQGVNLLEIKKKALDQELKLMDEMGKENLNAEKQRLATKEINQNEYAQREKEIAIGVAKAKLEILKKFGEESMQIETDFITAQGELDELKYQQALEKIKTDLDVKGEQLSAAQELAIAALDNELLTQDEYNLRKLEIDSMYLDAKYNQELAALEAEKELKRLNKELSVEEEQRFNAKITALQAKHGSDKVRLQKQISSERLKVEQYEFIATQQMISSIGAIVNNSMEMIGANSSALAGFKKLVSLMEIGINTGLAISEITKYAAADPKNAITGGIDIPLKIAAGIATVTANMASAIKLVNSFTAPPPPQRQGFYYGGFTPGMPGQQAGIVHGSEYVVDHTSLRDPFVMSVAQLNEAAKAQGTSVSNMLATNNYTSTATSDPTVALAINNLNKVLSDGIGIHFDDELAFKLNRELNRYKSRDQLIS